MNPRLIAILTPVLFLCFVSSLLAQSLREPVVAQKPTADSDASSATDEAAKAKAAKAKAQKAQKKAERLQKIQQLQFDRRPSTILKVWSTIEEKQKKDSETAQIDAHSNTFNPFEEMQKKDSETAQIDENPGTPKPDPFDEELKRFQRDVTLGNWEEVKHFLAEHLEADVGKAAYTKLLQGLMGNTAMALQSLTPAQKMQMRAIQSQQVQQIEKNTFSLDDVMALADAAPHELDKKSLISLGEILRQALDSGNVVESLLERLRAEIAKPKDEAVLTKREAAKLLFAAGKSLETGEFLPDWEQAEKDKDHEALNLLSRYFLALHAKEKKTEHLENAWRVTQAVLASGEIKKEEKDEALKRTVELAPKIREELGMAWLKESFTNRPQRGMEIIATIGAEAAQAVQNQPMNPDLRIVGLELQTTAVEALLEASSDQAQEWRSTLNLLAGNWLREAQISYKLDESTSLGPSLQRDVYGNYFYYNQSRYMGMQRQSNRIRPIQTGKLLEIKPGERWMELLNDSIRPKFQMIFAQLYLKVAEENLAFPYIEQLAKSHPNHAEDLVDEFLRVWTRNHDPNASRNNTNYYMFMYGFDRRAESIPLTRSKQERNLKELAELVKRLRALPLEELNEELLARAFTTCHSSAEVYRIEAIENVFGSLGSLEPKTLAEMAQQMRANLLGVWRQPSEQKNKKTKRKQKDIQAEVLRGYRVARAVIDGGLEKYPDEWALQLANASIKHDENNYRKELAPDSKFSGKREDAFAEFQKAADLYATRVKDLREDEETTRVYELWYYASLGACDLQHVTEEHVPDLRQPARIREAIEKLPGKAAERHIAMFANSLFTRMSAVKPAVKFRYLRNGFEIVGDHKHAYEARKVFDYYKDLVTEIKLETVIDGTDVVGHKKPFGVFVNLRHTREIERESGGFGRYLQNQNTQSGYFSYNYGRPTENYRDKFEEIVRQSVEEHFDVLSVTFQSEDVNSRAVEEYGWRVTPYAYILLKARGPEVDKIPPLRLDLDFLDTSGYVIIPVESPTLPIDASPEAADDRPIDNLEIVQTLDERQADEGKLILEVKATANGLVPELDQILNLAPEGFEIVNTDDQGLSVSRFDPESDESVIVSDRSWMITMQAAEDLKELPKSFQFGTPILDETQTTFQRYVDADLAVVEQKISLEQEYGETSRAGLWIAGIVVVAVAGLVYLLTRGGKTSQLEETPRFQVPEKITPFTVLGLLRQIEQNNGLNESGRTELVGSINRLEQYYFVDTDDAEPDLQEIAEIWIRKAK